MELPIDLKEMFKLIEDIHSITAEFRSNRPRPDYEETLETLQDMLWKLCSHCTTYSTPIVALCLGIQYALNGLEGYYAGKVDLDINIAWVITRYVYYAAKEIETKLTEIGD